MHRTSPWEALMQAPLSQDEFAVLVRRAGLRLTPTQSIEMFEAWQSVEPMLHRIRGHDRGREAEPANTFRPDQPSQGEPRRMSIPTIAEASRPDRRQARSPRSSSPKHCIEPHRKARRRSCTPSFAPDPSPPCPHARPKPRKPASCKAGGSRGPLDGIPIAHKDIYGTIGPRHHRPLQAPARQLGPDPRRPPPSPCSPSRPAPSCSASSPPTNSPWAAPRFDLPWPPARNPWNPDHFTSGSSSGTGAAVAAGMILGGTGSDTGGSIRGPAALCGIAGIKPTYGLCSRAGILPLAYSLDHAGPLAWTVEDCAILLQAMAATTPSTRPVPTAPSPTTPPPWPPASKACASASSATGTNTSAPSAPPSKPASTAPPKSGAAPAP